jgi:hypothetical protein
MRCSISQKSADLIYIAAEALTSIRHIYLCYFFVDTKVKAVPLQAWSGPEGSRKLRFQNFMKTAQDGCKVVGPMHTGRLYPQEIHLVLISVRG